MSQGATEKIVAVSEEYRAFLADIKGRIQTVQVRAALSLSREVIWLYWQIGHEILVRLAQHGWGSKVVERLAADPKAAFPGVSGFPGQTCFIRVPLRRRSQTPQLSNSCWTVRRCPGPEC